MTRYRSYNFDMKDVSALAVDTNISEYLWIGFKQNSDGICKLRKVSAHDLNQTYFEIDLEVDQINRMRVVGSKIFVLVSHDDICAFVLSVTNPITSQTEVSKPVGVIESPIDITDDGTNVYFLFPGIESGENAKIGIFDTNGSFEDVFDMSESAEVITNAVRITIDSNDEIQVVTNTAPINLVRVYDSGGLTMQVTELT